MPFVTSRQLSRLGLAGALLTLSPVVSRAQDAPPAATPAPDLDGRLKELEETVRALQATIQRLQGTPAATPKSGTPAATPKPPAAAGPDGFFVQSADGDFRLRVRGYVQADGRFFVDDHGDTGNSTFFLRRVRPIVEGTVYKNIDFRIMPDFGGGSTVLQDAYAELRYKPEAQIRVGKFKVPFSLERLQGGTDLLFIERSITNNLAPVRDVGVQIAGDLRGGVVSYALGAFNGVGDGVTGDIDGGDDKDFAARVFVQPFRNNAKSAFQGLGVGVAATTGRKSESVGGLTLRTAGRSSFFRYDNATIANGRQTRWAPQAYLYSGPFGLQGEYIVSQQAVRKANARQTLTNTSWFVQGSYVLTGEKASYRGVAPRRPFDPALRQPGAIELAARYSRFDADGDAFGPGAFADPAASAKKADAWTLGVNWYLNRGVKAQLNYEWTDFDRTLTFGSDQRDHENALLSRLQVQF